MIAAKVCKIVVKEVKTKKKENFKITIIVDIILLKQ